MTVILPVSAPNVGRDTITPPPGHLYRCQAPAMMGLSVSKKLSFGERQLSFGDRKLSFGEKHRCDYNAAPFRLRTPIPSHD